MQDEYLFVGFFLLFFGKEDGRKKTSDVPVELPYFPAWVSQ